MPGIVDFGEVCEGCCHKEYKGNYPPYDFSWETPCEDCPYLKPKTEVK